jgi:hypothetical protein
MITLIATENMSINPETQIVKTIFGQFFNKINEILG